MTSIPAPVEPLEVMIDLETLGTKPGSVILSIGAVKFRGSTILDKFYVRIAINDSTRYGLTIEGDTVLWWFKQSEEARAEFQKDAVSLLEALLSFSKWYGPESKMTWGNGANFDNALLQAAYRAANLPLPWKFVHDGCYRTVKGMSLVLSGERIGTYHHALDDAEFQTLHLMAIREGWRKDEQLLLDTINENGALAEQNQTLRALLKRGLDEFGWMDGPEGWDEFRAQVSELFPKQEDPAQEKLNLG
jgi:hypothetical protein